MLGLRQGSLKGTGCSDGNSPWGRLGILSGGSEALGEERGETSGGHVVLFPARHGGAPQARNSPRPALRRLSDYLLTNYKKGVRPVRDWRRPTTVAIDVIVYAILSVVSATPSLPQARRGSRAGGHGEPPTPWAARWASQYP